MWFVTAAGGEWRVIPECEGLPAKVGIDCVIAWQRAVLTDDGIAEPKARAIPPRIQVADPGAVAGYLAVDLVVLRIGRDGMEGAGGERFDTTPRPGLPPTVRAGPPGVVQVLELPLISQVCPSFLPPWQTVVALVAMSPPYPQWYWVSNEVPPASRQSSLASRRDDSL